MMARRTQPNATAFLTVCQCASWSPSSSIGASLHVASVVALRRTRAVVVYQPQTTQIIPYLLVCQGRVRQNSKTPKKGDLGAREKWKRFSTRRHRATVFASSGATAAAAATRLRSNFKHTHTPGGNDASLKRVLYQQRIVLILTR